MAILAINGSPRGNRSNTDTLLEYFGDGMSSRTLHEKTLPVSKEQEDIFFHIVSLKQYRRRYAELIEAADNFDTIMIGFPLYTDSMPGFVKELFEAIGNRKGLFSGKQFLFLIQSGFPEAKQSRTVERYCERFTSRVGAQYVGTIVRGKSEGVRGIRRGKFKDAELLSRLGHIFEEENRLDDALLRKIAMPESLPGPALFVMKILAKCHVFELMWNKQLKQNNAFDKRFDRPY